MQSANAIIGDQFGTDLPQTQVDQGALDEEKKMAKFSKTTEFKRLKDHIEGRITFYQNYLPNGEELNQAVTAQDWQVANRVIAEFKAILGAYEGAAEDVKNAETGR